MDTADQGDSRQDVPPQEDEEAPVCTSCGLPKWRTSWDLRLGSKAWTIKFEELRESAASDCQDCEFVLDAVLAYIAPKIDLHRTRISIRPQPEERRLYIHIKPAYDSVEEYAELDVLRFAGALMTF